MSTVQPPAASYGGIWRTRRTPHISPATSRPLCDDSPEPYPLPDRATCAGMPLSNNPGGDLRSFGHHQQFQSWKFIVREECRIGSAALRGTESWVCAARRSVPNRSSSACMGAGEDNQRASSDPSAPGASHANRQVRTLKLPHTELCIEPMPGRQLRRGTCVEA
jgi:hypothetical protein